MFSVFHIGCKKFLKKKKSKKPISDTKAEDLVRLYRFLSTVPGFAVSPNMWAGRLPLLSHPESLPWLQTSWSDGHIERIPPLMWGMLQTELKTDFSCSPLFCYLSLWVEEDKYGFHLEQNVSKETDPPLPSTPTPPLLTPPPTFPESLILRRTR